jgi:uncharacterized membrane protein YqaE (UPF0057 family)
VLYFAAVFLPPLAVLLCNRPGQALLNVFLTLLFWLPGMLHALFIVSSYYSDRRTDRVVQAIHQTAGLPFPRFDGRTACPQCGYANIPGRKWCKGCKRQLP